MGFRTVLALPALQAVSALLAEFSGPSSFPLAVFAVPFLAPRKALCAHRQGDTLRWADPPGLQLPPPQAQSRPPQEQKHRGEVVGAGGGIKGCTLFSGAGTIPLRARSPHSLQPRPTLARAITLKAACCSFPNLAASFHPQCPQYHRQLGSILNTAFGAQDPAAALTQLPLPTPSHQAHCCPGFPSSASVLHHHRAQHREMDPWSTENQPPLSFPTWGWMFRCCL